MCTVQLRWNPQTMSGIPAQAQLTDPDGETVAKATATLESSPWTMHEPVSDNRPAVTKGTDAGSSFWKHLH